MDATPIELSSTQAAQFQPDPSSPIELTTEQAAQFQPTEAAPVDVFKDSTPDQLAQLAKENPEGFNLTQDFLSQKTADPTLYNDPVTRQKVADALNLVKQDTEKDVLPHPAELVKGGIEGAKSIAVGAGTAVSHAVKAKLFLDNAMRHLFDRSTETSKSATAAQRELAEAWQGIQLSQTGILNQINALQNWAARKGGAVADAVLGLANKHTSDILGTPLALAGTYLKNKAETSPTVENLRRVFSGQTPDTTVGKQFKDYTPEERSRDLENILAQHEQEQAIAAGKEGSEISKLTTQGLAEHGMPVRPEESAKLAAADPFALAEFGGAFRAGQIGAKAVGGAIASALPESVQKVASAAAADLAELPRQAAGKALQAAGTVTKGAGKAAEVTGKIAAIAGPIYGVAKAALTGDWEHILGGTIGPKIVGEAASKIGTLAEGVAPKISEFGRQVESSGPITSANAQAVRDILNSAPAVATNIGEGAAFDYGLAQTTGETPEERKAVGLGTIFGALGAGREVGARFLHGQLIEPKAFKPAPQISSTRSFPSLEAMHADAVKGAPKADVNKINAVRALAQKYGASTDAFLSPDPAALKTALIDSGVSPETSDLYSKQNGAFIANLPDKNGDKKPVVIVNTGDAAPHELKHVFQQALGEEANKQVDDFIGSRYSPEEIDAEGQRYAQSTGGAQGNWVDSILKNSNWGEEEAKAKLGKEVLSQVPGADPKMESKWGQMAYDDLLERSGSKPGTAWEVLLSPEEKLEAARKFMKREIAARNFEAIFNNTAGTLTDAKGVLPGLARLVNRVTTTFGSVGTQGVSTEGGRVERPVMESVQRAVKGLNPDLVEPSAVPVKTAKRIVGVPATPEQQDRAAVTAQEVAAAAPDEKLPDASQTQKEILGTVAEAIAKRSPVQINYSSAPDEPAAATTANRNARRAMIEAYRDMPDSARALFPKGFSPEQVIVTKNGKYQVQGWAPEVLAANAHRMAEFLSKTGLVGPYEVDPATKSFTPAAWRQLYADIQTAAANIAGGRTGSGGSLVYPKELLGQGFYKPAEKGRAVPLDQDKADFINLLFGMKLPETARITSGKLPLNIAGQEISAATMPGRVVEPLRTRPPYTGPKAEALGIEGRTIQEVNPLRNVIEQAAKSAGIEPPSMIEALQHLNLESIKEIQHAPEVPDIRGNSMTLTAGFQPRISSAAVRDEDTKFLYKGAWHGPAIMEAVHGGANLGKLTEGFTDEAGNFLTREEAYQRAKDLGQIGEIPGNSGKLYSEDLDRNRPTAQFQGRTPQEIQLGKLQAEWDDLEAKKEAFYSQRQTPPEEFHVRQLELYELGEDLKDEHPELYDLSPSAQKALGKEVAGQSGNEPYKEVGKISLDDFDKSLKRIKPGELLDGPAWVLPDGSGVRVPSGATYHSDAVSGFKEFGNQMSEAQNRGAMRVATFDSPAVLHGDGNGHLGISVSKIPSESQIGRIQKSLKQRAVNGEPMFSKISIDIEGADGKTLRGQNFESFEGGKILRYLRNLGETEGPTAQFKPMEKKEIEVTGPDGKSYRARFDGYQEWPGRKPMAQITMLEDAPGTVKHSTTYDASLLERGFKLPELPAPGELDQKRRTGEWFRNEDNTHYRSETARYSKIPGPPMRGMSRHLDNNGNPIGREMNVPLSTEGKKLVGDGFEFSNPQLSENTFTLDAYDTSGEYAGSIVANSSKAIYGEPDLVGALGSVAPELRNALIGEAKANLNLLGVKSPKFDGADPSVQLMSMEDAKERIKTSLAGRWGPDLGSPQAREFFRTGKLNARGDYSEPEGKPKMPAPLEFADKVLNSLAEGLDKVEEGTYALHGKISKALGLEDTQFMPKAKKDDLKFLPTSFSEPSKAWILPDNSVAQLGAQWHHDWLDQNKDVQAKYGLKVPPFEGGDAEGVREAALQKGFARVNLDKNNGALTVEARQKDWKRVKPIVEDMIDRNLDDIDRFRVHLLDEKAGPKAVKTLAASLFNMDSDKEKMALATDILNETPIVEGQFQPKVNYKHPDFEPTLREVRTGDLYSGNTFNPDGSIWKPDPKTPVDIVTLASKNVLQDSLTPGVFKSAIEPYRELLKLPYFKAGVFSFDKDGKKVASIDINAVIPQEHRKNTKAFARDNDQVSFWDAAKRAEVKTGGSGSTILRSVPELREAAAALSAGKPVDVSDISERKGFEAAPATEQTQMFGGRELLSTQAKAEMSPAELRQHYPEAIVPANPKESIPSEIIGSPLYEEAGGGKPAVKAFADKLVDFAKGWQDHPFFKSGAKWYSEFTPMLKQKFGSDAPMMAELLAATSPQNPPETNYAYALDALEGFKSGRFDKHVSAFDEGMDKLNDGSWKETGAETPAQFMDQWIEDHDIKPRQSNGKLYAANSDAVLKVLARKWLDLNRGPKTSNFVANLLGTGDEATIDLWADRTMRRLGYEGSGGRWRILPANGTGVSDADFAFSQQAFRAAAERLGMKPSALQGALWFAEKQLWADNGWSRLDLGDYRKEIAKTDLLKQGIQHRLNTAEAASTVEQRPTRELELE